MAGWFGRGQRSGEEVKVAMEECSLVRTTFWREKTRLNMQKGPEEPDLFLF